MAMGTLNFKPDPLIHSEVKNRTESDAGVSRCPLLVKSRHRIAAKLSFPVYRRVATIFVPADSKNASSVEMVTIDPHDLQEAQDRDAATRERTNPTDMARQKLRSCRSTMRASVGDDRRP
jgi:hypothetical protein